MYEAELKELGLTDNEIKIYLALLTEGTLNPTQLAEKTGLHRSYVYDTTERLLEKGIINTVLINNKKSYKAVNPKALREHFEIKLRQIDSILPKLSKLFTEKKEKTSVELHKGKRVYRTLIKDLTANLKKGDIVYLIGANEELLEAVEPIYLKQYFTIIKERGVREKIIVRTGSKKLNNTSLEYKEVSQNHLGETVVVVFHAKVYFFIPGEPHYLIVIQSKKVADSYTKQFNLLWNLDASNLP